MSRAWSFGRGVAAAVAVAGVVGLGLLAAPAGAGAAPELPPVSPEELVSSVLTATPEPFAGTVEIVNALGLPALPELPQAANGTTAVRVWSGGGQQGRVQVPSSSGEQTLVSDGTTFWAWDSGTRTVTTGPVSAKEKPQAPTDPAAAAAQALALLRTSSVVTVDGTAEVAGRAAYELVLAPTPTERTLLREVRIAVDAQTRMPLRLMVLANGSTDPALQIGFSDITFGPQDPAMFTFTAPPGATVEQATPHEGGQPDRGEPGATPPGTGSPTVVGDGWDAVLVTTIPPAAQEERGALGTLGTPVSGAWGSGRLITTAVAGAVVTDDGRVAIGAVPEQVLTEALSR